MPGVVYGGDGEPVAFDVDARELRHALAHGGAVIDAQPSTATSATPVVLKDPQRHPVRGETMHIDLLRVRLDDAIQATVAARAAPAPTTRPASRRAACSSRSRASSTSRRCPNDIPDVDRARRLGAWRSTTRSRSPRSRCPTGVTLLDDLEETVVATLTPPRLETESEDEIETETELVGEGEERRGAGARARPPRAPRDGGDSDDE